MLKPVNKEKNPGLAKLPEKVRNKMGYAKKGKMAKAKKGKMMKAGLGALAIGAAAAQGLKKIMKKKSDVSPAMSKKSPIKILPVQELYQKATEQKKAKSGKMMKANVGMAAERVREKEKARVKEIKKKRNLQVSDASIKASMGKSVRGYGAARTSGMGLQDESLPPGKSLDYYKDLM